MKQKQRFEKLVSGPILVEIKNLGQVMISGPSQQLIYFAADAYNQLTGKVVPKKSMGIFCLVSFRSKTAKLVVSIKKK